MLRYASPPAATFVIAASVCSVDLGEKGMEALITLGAGDMRRTLNILQVAVSFLVQPAKLKLLYTLCPCML